MYHTVVYTAFTNGVTNFDTTPAQDPVLTISNGHYLPQTPLQFYMGWFGAVALTAVTLVTPTSRQIVPPQLLPMQPTALPPDRPHMFDRRQNPFQLNAVEEVSMQVNAGGAAPAQISLVMLWGTSIDPVPMGQIYTLPGTSTTAVVAGAWTQLQAVYSQSIPAGTYTVIGTQHVSATALAHRLIFKTSIMRPGFLSLQAVANIGMPDYYYGGMGSLGTFTTVTYPTWEVFCTSADAAHTLWINMIKTG